MTVNPQEHSPHPIDEMDIPISLHFKTINPSQEDSLNPASDEMDISEMLDEELKLRAKCDQVSYELPKFTTDFFGRKDKIEEMAARVVSESMHFFNVNGPLGCGKSHLAIQLGYRLVLENMSVSYIDISDRKLDQFSNNSNDPLKDSLPRIPPVQYIDYPMSERNYSYVHDIVLPKELLNWSKTITCDTVLILDNCDSVKDENTFVRFLKKLVSNSSGRLKVIVTSRSYLDSFESLTVSELNMESSMKLLNKVAPSIEKHHLDTLLALLGGCPLALKIAGNMLQHSHDHVAAILSQIDLQHLNRVSSQRQQFHDLVNIVYEFLPPNLRVCGHYLSLFPGSFDRGLGENIMNSLHCEESIDDFVQRSLLDEYLLAEEYRLKMPLLVEGYFRERNNRRRVADKKDFKRKFSANYVDLFVLEVMNPFQLRSPDEYKLKFSIESHNIYVLTMILFARVPNSIMSPKEMAALVPLTLEGWIPSHRILNNYKLYKELLAEMKPVCKYLPGSRCINFYSQLVSDIYHLECNNVNLKFSQFVQSIVGFQGNEKCGALFMNGTRIVYLRVWDKLGPLIQSFILTARLLSFKYVVWAIKVFCSIVALFAYVTELIAVSRNRADTRSSYLCFTIILPLIMFVFGVLLLFSTGNSDLAVILQLYIPSTFLILFLLCCFCYDSVFYLVISYLFRMWCILLFFITLVKTFFWLYSVLTVPFVKILDLIL